MDTRSCFGEAGGGGGCRVFCGEPIVPSSVVLGAAVTLDSRWLGLRAVGESKSCFQLYKWSHNLLCIILLVQTCGYRIWEQFRCIALSPIAA